MASPRRPSGPEALGAACCVCGGADDDGASSSPLGGCSGQVTSCNAPASRKSPASEAASRSDSTSWRSSGSSAQALRRKARRCWTGSWPATSKSTRTRRHCSGVTSVVRAKAAPRRSGKRRVAAELAEEPGLRRVPVTLDGGGGGAHHLGGFLHSEAAEEAQLDDLRLVG